MKRFVEGVDRGQSTLFPECLEDWVVEDNPVRVIDAFVDALDLGSLGFGGVDPEAVNRRSKLTPYRRAILTPWLAGWGARRRCAEPLRSAAHRRRALSWLLL